MDVKKLEDEKSKFNLKTVKEIFDKIETMIKNNVGPLHIAVNDDNKEYSETMEYTKLLETIDRARKEKWIMEDSSKNVMFDGIGNIAAIISDVPDVSLYLILKALKTHNNIVLFVADRIHVVTQKIIDIVMEACKEVNYKTYIDFFEYSKDNQILDFEENFKSFIFVNEPEKYFKLTEIIKDKNIIYSSFGTMSLYLDDKNLKDELLRMDEFVFNNNIDLDLIKDVSVEDAVDRINKNIDNYSAIIFTKDTKKAYYFIENTNAKQIFVNKNPYKDYLFDIDDEKLTRLKRIYI